MMYGLTFSGVSMGKREHFLLNEVCNAQDQIGPQVTTCHLLFSVGDTVNFSYCSLLFYLTLFALFVVLMNCLTHL